MFTSVELDDELFDQAFALSGARTKRAFFDEMLRLYVQLHAQAEVRALRGKLVWKDDLSTLRESGGGRANRR